MRMGRKQAKGLQKTGISQKDPPNAWTKCLLSTMLDVRMQITRFNENQKKTERI